MSAILKEIQYIKFLALAGREVYNKVITLNNRSGTRIFPDSFISEIRDKANYLDGMAYGVEIVCNILNGESKIKDYAEIFQEMVAKHIILIREKIEIDNEQLTKEQAIMQLRVNFEESYLIHLEQVEEEKRKQQEKEQFNSVIEE